MKYRFEVLINGERKCIAGVDGLGVLTAEVTGVETILKGEESPSIEYDCVVGGLDSTHRHPFWLHEDQLKAGDEITVRILDEGDFDPPISYQEFPRKEEQR